MVYGYLFIFKYTPKLVLCTKLVTLFYNYLSSHSLDVSNGQLYLTTVIIVDVTLN